MSIDLRRTVPARTINDVTVADAAPGDVEVLAIDGVVWGYGYVCAGCGERSYLALSAEDPGPRWNVTAGDVRKPETVTLAPSIHHTTAKGGCGYHAWLRGGVWTPV